MPTSRTEGSGGGCQLRLISAMGGTDSKVSDFRFAAGQFDWSPDGRFIVAGISQRLARQQPAGLYLLPVAGGTPRRLTTPKVVTDQAPAFSRDGRRLAYASCSASIVSACDVYVLDLDTAFTPVGQARRLTSQGAAISGLTWSRNGQSIIYDAQAVPGLTYLWSVDVAGHDQPVRIEVAGVRASEPATTSAMDRLVFSRSLLNLDVYEMAWGHPPQPVAASSFDDFLARFSPDGRQIVFCSARSGESFELWIASADGSGARQLTRGLGRGQCAGIWSPNGQQIAFDSLGEDGRWHIWLIDPDGGTPRQVTTDPGSQRGPSWSHDGQWIYYWLQQSDHSDVWRTRLSDGVKEQLTHDGKTEFGVELFDGSHFLYQTESGALMEAPLEGGSARQLVKCAILRGVRRGFERHLLRGMRTALRSPCVFAQSRDWQAAIAWAAREADAKHAYCYTWGISRRHASSLHSRCQQRSRSDVDRELPVNRRCLTRTTGRPRRTFKPTD